jgi:hypothetical protein
MIPNLGKYVNKTILVSIPTLCGDVKCRPYKLKGVELIGLWLEGANLTSGFLAHENTSLAPTTWAFFIPYSQIACVAFGSTPGVVTAGETGSAVRISFPAQGAPPTVAGAASSTAEMTPRKRPKTKEQ